MTHDEMRAAVRASVSTEPAPRDIYKVREQRSCPFCGRSECVSESKCLAAIDALQRRPGIL